MRGIRPWRFAAAAFFAGAVVAQGAEEAGGTLEQTRQELQQLQKDQKDKAAPASDKARLSTPTLDLRAGEGSAESWLANKQDKERKLRMGNTAGNPNWLAQGVEKLEKEEAQMKAGQTALAKDSVTKGNAAHPIDQNDSQYLLKLFDEQKKAGEPKPGAKSASTAAPDPFAPFMESWLASSPSRGQFFDQFASKSDAGPAGLPAGGPANYSRPAAALAAPVTTHDALVAEKTNPYLAELNAPILGREIVSETNQLQPAVGPSPAVEAAKSGPAPIPAAQPTENRERARAPLPGLADDRKYFPQLKKF